jgi:hypothetical protein
MSELQAVDKMTVSQLFGVQGERIREALELLTSLGYEIRHNGHLLKRTGKHSWTWMQP